MRTFSLLAIATLPLAACGGGGAESGNNSQQAATVQEQVPDQLTDDPHNAVVPVAAPSLSPVATIPAAFQGRWGMTVNDCDPKQDFAAKGLMTIAGNRLSFYESRGTAANIRQLAEGRIAFDLPMSGEGMSWSEPTSLTLEGDGRTLVREATGPADRAGANRYQKCPA